MPSAQPSFLSVRGVLNAITTSLRDLMRNLRDPYQPERHYMRGPGPKWRAKQGLSSAGRLPIAT